MTPLEGIQKLLGPEVKVAFAPDNENGAAVQAAKSADAAVVFIGNHPTCNAGWNHCLDPGEGKEAIDRKTLELDVEQVALVQQVYAANPKTVVILVSSFPYAIQWVKGNIPAILHMAHNSEEEGTAIAEALFGVINPGGRLVHTWPSSNEQLPQMMDYNIRNGRTYLYFKGEPLFPFGFGLSYSTFKYSDLKMSPESLRSGGEVTMQVDITNTSNRAGDEVVQLYAKHLNSKVSRPTQQLVAFQRVSFQAGEKKTVSLRLPARSLAYWNESANSWTVEADKVQFRLGSSSADIKATREVQIKE